MTQLINELILIAFGLGAIALIVWTSLAIARNFRAGREFRERLMQRLQALRMHRVAKALGIDVEHCLHDEMVVRIEENMRRCEACEALEACDEKLAKGALSTDEIEFCPNRDCLAEYASMQATGDRRQLVANG
jgi:hypothetical protein